MPELIFGIDPGLSTGVAVIDPRAAMIFLSFTMEACDWNSVTERLHDLICHGFYGPYCIDECNIRFVVEDYHGGAGGKLQSTVNQIIGACLALAKTNRFVYCAQENIRRTPWIDEAKRILKSLNVKHTPHQVDALAHALSMADVDKGVEWRLYGED